MYDEELSSFSQLSYDVFFSFSIVKQTFKKKAFENIAGKMLVIWWRIKD